MSTPYVRDWRAILERESRQQHTAALTWGECQAILNVIAEQEFHISQLADSRNVAERALETFVAGVRAAVVPLDVRADSAAQLTKLLDRLGDLIESAPRSAR